MELDLQKGSEWVLNPLIWACWADEDFIGKVARISRKTHRRTEGLRTLEKALMQYVKLWKEIMN